MGTGRTQNISALSWPATARMSAPSDPLLPTSVPAVGRSRELPHSAVDAGQGTSAWFMTHRIREAMKREPIAGMLKGNLDRRRSRSPSTKSGPPQLNPPEIERGGL
jgi:hypothetical protein